MIGLERELDLLLQLELRRALAWREREHERAVLRHVPLAAAPLVAQKGGRTWIQRQTSSAPQVARVVGAQRVVARSRARAAVLAAAAVAVVVEREVADAAVVGVRVRVAAAAAATAAAAVVVARRRLVAVADVAVAAAAAARGADAPLALGDELGLECSTGRLLRRVVER